MSLELANDIGIRPLPVFGRALLRGVSVLCILLMYLIVYQFISVSISGLRVFFPSTSDYLKRITCANFWELSLYFLEQNGVKFQIVGDELEADSALLISNHYSLCDHFVFAYLARLSASKAYQITKNSTKSNIDSMVLPKINFFTWYNIWQIPTLKILKNLASCDENWELDEKSSLLIFKKMICSKVPEWIVLFPEVNIFNLESSRLQKEMCDKFYLPKFQNLLYPRFSSFYNSIQALSETSFARLYDVSIIYYRNPVGFNHSNIIQENDKIAEIDKPVGMTGSESLMGSPITHKKREMWERWERKEKDKERNKLPILNSAQVTIATGSTTAAESFNIASSSFQTPVSTGKKEKQGKQQKASNFTTDGIPIIKPGGEFKQPSLLELFSLNPSPYVIRIHIKSRMLQRVPVKKRRLEKWLEMLWADKDKLIDSLKEDILKDAVKG